MKKIIYIVLDGLADMPFKELNDKTPLEAAVTLNLDRLAQKGRLGLLHPADKQVIPDCDTALFSLLGYNILTEHISKGALEALSCGMDFINGNLAFGLDFAVGNSICLDIAPEEAVNLTNELNNKIILSDATFEIKNINGHHGVMVLRGIRCGLTSRIQKNILGSQTPLDFEYVPAKDAQDFPGAIETAKLLNEFLKKSDILFKDSAVNKNRLANNKPVINKIIFSDFGDYLADFKPLRDIYPGLKFGCFIQSEMIQAIAKISGMQVIKAPLSTGLMDVDYSIWAKLVLDGLTEFDCVFVHLKGPDEASCMGDFIRKKAIIEAIDQHFCSNILAGINLQDCLICVTSDHSSACSVKRHTSDPVPFLLSGGKVKPDGSLSFSEKCAKQGSLGEIKGTEVLPLLVKLASQ